MHILIVATPVAPLGQGKSGGVTSHIINTAAALKLRGHETIIMAMEGSETAALPLLPVSGAAQPSLASEGERIIYPIPVNGALANMWREAYRLRNDFDMILNFAHDWLPYYLTSFFPTPVHHIVNMTDVNEPTSREIVRIANTISGSVAFMTRAQAERFAGLKDAHVISFGINLSDYEFSGEPQADLMWAGRISPEKGLEDALIAAASLGRKLTIAGSIDNDAYWKALRGKYRGTIDYKGFLPTHELQALMGGAQTLIQTQKWYEAFGIVTIEAMACGTPVIGYERGANKDLVRHGETGLLVRPDDTAALQAAIGKTGALSRRACREHVERNFSLNLYGERLHAWLDNRSMRQ